MSQLLRPNTLSTLWDLIQYPSMRHYTGHRPLVIRSLRHRVGTLWCARGFAFRLGQDRLRSVYAVVQFGCRTIGIGRILHVYRVGVNTFFMLEREGNHGLSSGWS